MRKFLLGFLVGALAFPAVILLAAALGLFPIGQIHPIRLKVPNGFKSNWYTGTAHLLLDDDPRERRRWLASQLPSSTGNSRAVRLFGTHLLTLRIDLDS